MPPIRLLLIWDNLTGHQTPDLLDALVARGVWPLFTPLGGSWLNLAESVQRILVRRALDGQHPTSAQEVMTWLREQVAGWNADPTPFVWGGTAGGAAAASRSSGATGWAARGALLADRSAAAASAERPVRSR